MNFLAHAYLSFNKEDIIVGNMISDFVKGKKKFEYSYNIQQGIFLHREIDNFTDQHMIIKEAKKLFANPYRLYAGAFIDVAMDHFLAVDKKRFEAFGNLSLFSASIYNIMQSHLDECPLQFQIIFPYMKCQDWLANYSESNGIDKAFDGLVRRAAYLSDSTEAKKIFYANYQALKYYYEIFFNELEKFSLDVLGNLSIN
ncbi:MAG: ACP phosphodiesterase [Ginsengibacter sp.]